MDEITLLKTLENDVPEVDSATLIRARRRLLERAIGPSLARRRHRRNAIRIVAVAASMTVILTVGLATFRGNPVAQPASASEILNRAAAAVGTTGGSPYEHVTVTSETAAAHYDTSGEIAIGSDGKPVTWKVRTVTESWIGADDPDSYVSRGALTSYAAQSTDSKPYLESGSRPLARVTTRAASYSTDPKTLLKQLGAGPVKGSWDAYTVSKRFSGLLFSPTTPPKVRAAGYRALALVPGVKVTDRSTTLGGHAGVALAYPGGMTFVFDDRTGSFIGSRWPSFQGGTESTILTIEGVDSAPTP